MKRHIGALLIGIAAIGLSNAAPAADAAWKAVDEAMRRPGALQSGDVYKFSFPRSDLKVMEDGVAVKPARSAPGSHSKVTAGTR